MRTLRYEQDLYCTPWQPVGNQEVISPLCKCLYGQLPHSKHCADTSLWSSSDWDIDPHSWTSHSQRSIKQKWINQAEPLLTAAVFTKSIYCRSCQSTIRRQSFLGDRRKNLCSSNVRKNAHAFLSYDLYFSQVEKLSTH